MYVQIWAGFDVKTVVVDPTQTVNRRVWRSDQLPAVYPESSRSANLHIRKLKESDLPHPR